MRPDLIEIVSYNEQWPAQFEQAQHLLQHALQNSCLSIDHIGSTAVPGLRSKACVDIQITVRDLTESGKEELDRRLTSNGFSPASPRRDHRPPGDTSLDKQWDKYFIPGAHPQLPFAANIHVRKMGAKNWRYPLLFRDYLRAHPLAAEAYARAKEKLAEYLSGNRAAYSDAKDPICDLIMLGAEDWAHRVQWKPEMLVGYSCNGRRSLKSFHIE